MKLQKREKYLLGAVVGLLILAGFAVLMMFGDDRSIDTLNKRRNELDLELKRKKNDLDREAEHARQLADWQRRSLPSERNFARSLYDAWLSDLCRKSNLQDIDLQSGETEGALRAYTRMPYTINAHATLEHIVDFLYAFYSAGHLHQIRRLEIKPPATRGSSDFEVHISVEALSLPDAVSKTELSTEAGHGLKLSSVAAYVKEIVGRNFFAAYTPQVVPNDQRTTGLTTAVGPPPRPPDPAKFAKVTSIMEIDGIPFVWLLDRMAGHEWQLAEGDKFKVGGGTGEVDRIDPDGEVILRFEGKLRSLDVGDSLREGKEVKE